MDRSFEAWRKPGFICARGEDRGTRADRWEKTHREKKPLLRQKKEPDSMEPVGHKDPSGIENCCIEHANPAGSLLLLAGSPPAGATIFFFPGQEFGDPMGHEDAMAKKSIFLKPSLPIAGSEDFGKVFLSRSRRSGPMGVGFGPFPSKINQPDQGSETAPADFWLPQWIPKDRELFEFDRSAEPARRTP
jgi:hypothetical protein